MQAQLESMERGSFGRMLDYLRDGHRNYSLSLPNIVNKDFHNLLEFFTPRNVVLFLQLQALTRHTTYVDRHFKDPRLRIAFTFHDMYMGLSPYAAPATYSFLQYTELTDGIWYPMGGMYRVIEVLAGIAEKHGVRFLFNAPVKRILVDGHRTTGVVLDDGQVLHADIVVANADMGYVYHHLLPSNGMAKRLDRKEYGCSTLMFYWGMDRQYPELAPHNLILSGDYRQSFKTIFKDLSMPDEPNFYIHAPARVDPALAPAGQDTLIVAIPVGHIDDEHPQDWKAIQSKARSFVFKRLAQIGLPDLESHIKFEVSYTPVDWRERYNLTKGCAHGLSHKLTQMAYFRPHPQHRQYRNLYFVGAGTHPGTGMPSVLVSAGIVAERVFRDHGKS
jgi:phytoene desaturase